MRIETINVRKGDKLVLFVDQFLPVSQRDAMKAQTEQEFGCPVIVLSGGVSATVLRAA